MKLLTRDGYLADIDTDKPLYDRSLADPAIAQRDDRSFDLNLTAATADLHIAADGTYIPQWQIMPTRCH